MKKSRYSEDQITFALKQAELGTPIEEVCRKMGISDATFYNCKKKCSGLGPSKLRRLKQLEEENAKLRRIVADLSLDKSMVQDVLKKTVKSSLKWQLVDELITHFGASFRQAHLPAISAPGALIAQQAPKTAQQGSPSRWRRRSTKPDAWTSCCMRYLMAGDCVHSL